MSIVFYHSVESTCAQKVRFVLVEKGLEWTEHLLNLRKGDQFRPEYLKLNPKAVVPTLVNGKDCIRESSVIAEYIDDAFPDPPLRPADPGDRAIMRLFMKAFDEEIHPATGVLSYGIFLRHQMNELKTAEELEQHFQSVTDPGRRERQRQTHEHGLKSPTAIPAIQAVRRVVEMMEDQLKNGEWLAGDSLSLADLSAVPYMVRLRELRLSAIWEARPNVTSWLGSTIARAESHRLDDPWGSSSFFSMVAEYAEKEWPQIKVLLEK